MHRLVWGGVLLAALAVGCGSTRERASGTRNGTGSPGTRPPDSGVVLLDAGGQGTVDAGAARDGGVGPVELDRNAQVSSLGPAELAELCAYVAATQGTEVVQCDGFEVTPTGQQDCESSPPSSTCTVGQVLDCMDSLAGDLCQLFQSDACLALFQC